MVFSAVLTAMLMVPGRGSAQTAPPSSDPTPVPGGLRFWPTGCLRLGVDARVAGRTDGTIARDYPVSGHKARWLPGTGEFWVYFAFPLHPRGRATHTDGVHGSLRPRPQRDRHRLPQHPHRGRPTIQSVNQLGQPLSAGCVRQGYDNARFLFDWAPEGTTVVVIDTSGQAPPAAGWAYPRGRDQPSDRTDHRKAERRANRFLNSDLGPDHRARCDRPAGYVRRAGSIDRRGGHSSGPGRRVGRWPVE